MQSFHKSKKANEIRQILTDPVLFTEMMLNQKIWSMQKSILHSVATHPRTAVKACHSSGKTHTAAAAVLSWITTQPEAIAVTTAPTWTQVERVLWGEIHSLVSKSVVAYPRPAATSLHLGPNRYAIGLSTNEGVRFQGFHGNVLIVLDEAPGILAEIWEAIEGIRAGGDVRVLALGNRVERRCAEARRKVARSRRSRDSRFRQCPRPVSRNARVLPAGSREGSGRARGEEPRARLLGGESAPMVVQLWSIEKIIPYAHNARKIPPEAVDKVAASIREFGWRQPIVVDKDSVIIVGHVRLQAAKKLGLREVPVHVADNLTPAQVRAYRILDNRSHEETSWDDDLLGRELLDLKGLGVDLELTGFEMEEIDDLLARATRNDGLTDPDAVPEAPEHAVSQMGDMWALGNHRLLCGDATDLTAVERVVSDGQADMVYTDPPYNVDYTQPSRSPGREGRKIANDNLGVAFEEFLSRACRSLLTVTEGAIYISMSSSEIDTLKRVFIDRGGHWSTFVIWAKNTFTLGRSDYQRQYEPILYGWREGGEHYWCGARIKGMYGS